MAAWHPRATVVPIPSAPRGLTFAVGAGKKLVWHTTEGSSIDGAVGAYKAAGVCPHFTIAVSKFGKRTLYQHLPITVASSALKHPAGTQPTNTAGCIQVEIVGFAKDSATWSRATYFYLYWLAKWINKHAGVQMMTAVSWRHPARMTQNGFFGAEGHVGHMHVPGNDHTDPGTGFHIGRVTKFPFKRA